MSQWQGKVVLVTGGSSGLGRSIAVAFAKAGAKVAIAARGAEKLATTVADAQRSGATLIGFSADVTRDEDVARLIAEVVETWGRLDVLVNCAGRSARGAALDATPADFQAALDLNFLAAVRCTRAAAPLLLAAGGHVVNIGSLASKSAPRYMGPYAASKFALAAYSQQLRLETAERGLHVLLVCPGPLAGRALSQFSAAELASVPESARGPGGGVKLKQIDPDWLSAQVVRACERHDAELVVPAKARILFALNQLSPKLGDWLTRRVT